MKRRSIFLMTLTLIMLLCGPANATYLEARGSAVVTGMRAKHRSSTDFQHSIIWVTNITGSDVECRVNFFDHAGDDVTSYCTVYSGNASSNAAVTIATGTGTFDLPAGETRYVYLTMPNTSRLIQGHAVIEWASTNPHLRKALIAAGECRVVSSALKQAAGFTINGGQPF